jgi:hypothetical protein
VSELPAEFQMYQDADVDSMKKYFARMFSQGHPLILHPRLAKDATTAGFEEGVHFIVSRPLPLA